MRRISPKTDKMLVISTVKSSYLKRELEEIFVRLNETAPKGMYNFRDIETNYPHLAEFTRLINQS